MTVEIEMTDAEFETVSNYAAENNFSVPEIFFKTLLEKIENAEWLKISEDIIKERSEAYKALAK